MPTLQDIRRRIRSVKKTQQITRAMRMVAGAKLRRAQDVIVAARPYADLMHETLAEVARAQPEAEHPLLVARPEVRVVEAVVVTSDRGLCGAFNANVIKKVEQVVENELSGYAHISLRIIGRKANQHFVRRHANIASYDGAPTNATALTVSGEMANRVIDDFLQKKVDKVFL
ncbi:MAG TPA: F0F1 ATP synthase subunit gamma, partial [Myxococcota bacterium]|nr:F0F1 ATP synthase subunit gamma [Myxococcota bacterium]